MLDKLLIKHKLISEEKCRDIFAEISSYDSYDIAKTIVAAGVMDEETLASSLMKINNCERLPANVSLALPQADAKDSGIDSFVFYKLKTIPVVSSDDKDNYLKVAMVNPYDRAVVRQLEFFGAGKRIKPVLATLSQITNALELSKPVETTTPQFAESSGTLADAQSVDRIKFEDEVTIPFIHDSEVNENIKEEHVDETTESSDFTPSYDIARLNKEMLSVLLSSSSRQMFERAAHALSNDIPKGMIVWFDENKLCLCSVWNKFKNTYDIFEEVECKKFDPKFNSNLKRFVHSEWRRWTDQVLLLEDKKTKAESFKLCFKSIFYSKNLACIIFPSETIMSDTGYLNTVSEMLHSVVRRIN